MSKIREDEDHQRQHMNMEKIVYDAKDYQPQANLSGSEIPTNKAGLLYDLTINNNWLYDLNELTNNSSKAKVFLNQHSSDYYDLRNSCTIGGSITTAVYNGAGIKKENAQSLLGTIANEQEQAGLFFRGYGAYTVDSVKAVSKKLNMKYFRLNRYSPYVQVALDKGYSLVIGYNWSNGYRNDRDDNAEINSGDHSITGEGGHALSHYIDSNLNYGVNHDQYPNRITNRYKNEYLSDLKNYHNNFYLILSNSDHQKMAYKNIIKKYKNKFLEVAIENQPEQVEKDIQAGDLYRAVKYMLYIIYKGTLTEKELEDIIAKA